MALIRIQGENFTVSIDERHQTLKVIRDITGKAIHFSLFAILEDAAEKEEVSPARHRDKFFPGWR